MPKATDAEIAAAAGIACGQVVKDYAEVVHAFVAEMSKAWAEEARQASAEARRKAHEGMAKKILGGKHTASDAGDHFRSSWSKSGGYADAKFKSVGAKLEREGFVHSSSRPTGSPDGAHMGSSSFYEHPNGHIVSMSSSYGPTSYSNHHYIELTTKK
jgi:hypothetical protein